MADREQTAKDVLHANIDKLWDAIALLDSALQEQGFDSEGGGRVVRIASEKLHELDEILSPLV